MDNKGKNGRPTSWVCTCIASGEVFEFFTKSNADKARDSGIFKVEEAGEYLGRINQESNGNASAGIREAVKKATKPSQ